jgi:hypothetical protein
MKGDEVGEVCSTQETDETYIQNFGRKTERNTSLGRRGPNGRLILEWILQEIELW